MRDVRLVGAGRSRWALAFQLLRATVTDRRVVARTRAGRAGPWRRFAGLSTPRSPRTVNGPDLGVPSSTYRAWHEARFGAAARRGLETIAQALRADDVDRFRRSLDPPVANGVAPTRLRDGGGGVTADGALAPATPWGTVAAVVIAGTGLDVDPAARPDLAELASLDGFSEKEPVTAPARGRGHVFNVGAEMSFGPCGSSIHAPRSRRRSWPWAAPAPAAWTTSSRTGKASSPTARPWSTSPSERTEFVPIVFLTDMSAEREARWRDVLAHALPEEEIVAGPAVGADGRDPAVFDVAIAANPPAAALARFPALRFVQSLWAGVEQLVHNPALPPDAPLARLVDPNLAQAMAEAVAAHVLSLHRDHGHYARAQAAGRWAPEPVVLARDRTVAFLGTGELARACMRQLAGFAFARLGWSRRRRDVDGVETFTGDDGLRAMLARTDILVNLLPLTTATRGLIDARLLGALKRGAALVNVARGGHVVDADLLAALNAGQLRDAVLDVFHEEPPPADHPFWRHPRVHVFPHVAAPTDPESAAAIAARNIRAFRTGGAITGLVDRSRGY